MGEKESLELKRATIIKNIIISWYGCDPNVFTNRSRKEEEVRVRQVTAYCLCHYCGKLQLNSIGIIIGGYDHATVLHSKRSIQNLIDSNKDFRDRFQQLIDVISRSMLDIQLNGELIDHSDQRVASLIAYNLWLSKQKVKILHEDNFELDNKHMTAIQMVTKYLSAT